MAYRRGAKNGLYRRRRQNMRIQKWINTIKKIGNSHYLNVPRGVIIMNNWKPNETKMVITEWTNKKIVFELFDVFDEKFAQMSPKEEKKEKNDKD